jgi:YD repeat-containing protein
MPSRLKNKLIFVTAIIGFLFTMCLPSYSGASNYSYDNGNRLIRVDYENGSNIAYSYDESSNRTQSLTTSATAPSMLQVTVRSDAQNTLPGINLYLFNDAGSYLGLTQVTNASGVATFAVPAGNYKVRADYMGCQFWSNIVNFPATSNLTILIAQMDVQVNVTTANGVAEDVTVYLFTAEGSYLGISSVTDASGNVTFKLPVGGSYKVRADIMGNQYWSGVLVVTGGGINNVAVAAGGGILQVNILEAAGVPLTNVLAYLFSDSGSYLGMSQISDSAGNVSFVVPQGAYKIRVDYLGYQFWSDVINVSTTLTSTMVIPMSTVVVNVGDAYGVTSGVNVYLFSETGSYLGVNALTDAAGNVTFNLPVGGHYKLRHDILGNQYWSDVIIVAGGGANNIALNAGGGMLQVNILKAAGIPLTGVTAYLFNQNGSYLGMSQTADAAGKVAFNVPSGTYKVRVDYLGYQFWSSDNLVNADMITNLTIPHKDVTITVGGLYQGASTPMANVNVYLFDVTGSYLGKTFLTDANGRAVFNLPDQAYKVRADYLGQQYWSGEFTWLDNVVNIPMANVTITMLGAGMLQANVPVYVFSSTNSYLGVTANTGTDGNVTFRIPAGTYKFRADYQDSQFWTDDQTIIADQINNISLSAGGGNFTLTVKANADPLSGVNCYVFNSEGAYLGLSGVTNNNGQYIFDLSTGDYKIRVDYMGYQFWTDMYSVPTQLAAEFTIELSDTPVTVSAFYLSRRLLSNLNVYLFTQDGAYVNITKVTDANGGAVFSIPNKGYKIRVDYLGYQFWANIVMGQSSQVIFNEGLARVYAHTTAGPVAGAAVYLFSESGEYLGLNAVTDTDGNAEFTLPAYSFQFRVDVAGVQYWSQVISPVAGGELVVDVSAD